MEAKFEELIEGFVTGNIGISEDFLSVSLALGLRQNLLLLNKDSSMVPAGIGNTLIKDELQKMRSDKTSWLQDDSKNDAEIEFMDMIRQFMGHLNRTCFTGLNAFEFHYALYETGTFYKRHTDQLRYDDNRKFSMITYLNENWKESDGGQLVIYQDGAAQQISPNNQKAIFFQSDVLEHEVVVAKQSRLSVTGWLKRV